MIAENDLLKFTKEVFLGSKSSDDKRSMTVSASFIQGYFDEFGKDGLKSLVEKTDINTSIRGFKLIKKLLK